MISSIGLIGLVVVVYWCRGYIQKHIQGITRLIGGSARSGLVIYTLIFFPGVLLHEMSHFLMAAVLGVRTGEINLFPRFDEDINKQGSTALGSVQVARSDVFRGSLIGAAPFITGSLVLYFMVTKYFFDFKLNGTMYKVTWSLDNNQPILTAIMLYLIFVFGNTMFSSKEDTRSWPLIVILMVTLGLIGYISGTISGAVDFLWPIVTTLANTLLGAMFFVALIDALVIAGLFLAEKVLEKMLKKRVRYGV